MKKIALVVALVVVAGSMIGCQQQAAPGKAAPAKAEKKVEKAPATAPAKVAEKAPAGPATAKAEAAKGDWKLAYTAQFAGKLDKAWSVFQGDAEVKDGKLIVSSEVQDATTILTAPAFTSPSVRVELTASLEQAPQVSDLSILLNASKNDPMDGYLFQFGGKGNTMLGLNKHDEIIKATVKDKPLVVPGKKYQIVAENDKGHLKLIVDGQTVIDYVDPSPISGKDNALIGFYTWESKLVIEKLAVYQK